MQAPIGPATTPGLVAAVASRGGLGCLAASWTPLPLLREQIHEIRARTDAPYCVNLVLAFDQRERAALLAAEEVPVVSLSWGIDRSIIAALRQAGVHVLVQVGDVAEAERAVAAGADGLIAQGIEAGGHVQARRPLLELLAALRGTAVPVIAAGGICSAGSVRAALAAGAAGVAAGSAFLMAHEADVHPEYRRRLLAATASDTVVTELFDVGWPSAPHRVLRNSTYETWLAAGCPASGSRPGEGERIATRGRRPVLRYSDVQPTGDTEGDTADLALYAGAGVGDLREVEPAAEITARLLAATV